jgi:hypothetical protein
MIVLNTSQYEHVLLLINVFHPIEDTDNFSMVLNINNKILLDIDMSYDNNLELVPPLLDNYSIESNLLHELQTKQRL